MSNLYGNLFTLAALQTLYLVHTSKWVLVANEHQSTETLHNKKTTLRNFLKVVFYKNVFS